MKAMKKWFGFLARGGLWATWAGRYPLGMAASLALGILAVGLVWADDPGTFAESARLRWLFRLGVAWWPVLAANAAWGLLGERRGMGKGLYATGLAVLAVGWGAGLWSLRNVAEPEAFFGSSRLVVSWLAVYVLAGLALWLAACAGRGGGDVREFRRGVWGTVVAGWLAGLMGWLLATGLSWALVALAVLFDWPERDAVARMAGTLWIVAGIVLAPALGYARFPRGRDEEWPPVPSWTTWLARRGLVPIAGVYAVILVAYLARLLIRLDWPTGMLAWPVLAFEILGWTAWGWLRGERGEREAEPAWSRVLLRGMPWAGAAMAAVLALAVSVRTEAYGTTVLRAAGYWAAAWFMAVGVLYAVRPGARTRAAAVLACGVAVLAAWGPLSVRNVAIRSQLERIRVGMGAVLEAARDGATLPAEVEDANWKQARDAADYLGEWFGPGEIDFPEGEMVRAALAEAAPAVQVPEDARPWEVLFLAAVRLPGQDAEAEAGDGRVEGTASSGAGAEESDNPARVRTERAMMPLAGWERLWWTADSCGGEPWEGLPWRLEPVRGPVAVADGTPLAEDAWRAFVEKARDRAYGAKADDTSSRRKRTPTAIVEGDDLVFEFTADGWMYRVQFRSVKFENGEVAATSAGFVLGCGIRAEDGAPVDDARRVGEGG